MSPVPAPVRRSGVIAALVLALFALVPIGSPAHAATPGAAKRSCTVHVGDESSVQKAAEGVDAVIAARITKADKTPGPKTSGLKPSSYWTYTLRVLATFRGPAQPGTSAELTLVPQQRQPGTPLVKGSTYLLFLDQSNAAFTADRCGGSALLTHGLSSSLEARLTADLTGSTESGVTVQWTPPKDGVRDVPSLNRLIAPGVGLALIGVLGLLVIARLARERS